MKMDPKICENAYDPNHDYKTDNASSPYDRNTVYFYQQGKRRRAAGWFALTTATSNIGCPEARTALENFGRWTGRIGTGTPFGCGGTYLELRTGNYLTFTGWTARRRGGR